MGGILAVHASSSNRRVWSSSIAFVGRHIYLWVVGKSDLLSRLIPHFSISKGTNRFTGSGVKASPRHESLYWWWCIGSERGGLHSFIGQARTSFIGQAGTSQFLLLTLSPTEGPSLTITPEVILQRVTNPFTCHDIFTFEEPTLETTWCDRTYWANVTEPIPPYISKH